MTSLLSQLTEEFEREQNASDITIRADVDEKTNILDIALILTLVKRSLKRNQNTYFCDLDTINKTFQHVSITVALMDEKKISKIK